MKDLDIGEGCAVLSIDIDAESVLSSAGKSDAGESDSLVVVVEDGEFFGPRSDAGIDGMEVDGIIGEFELVGRVLCKRFVFHARSGACENQ